jgi:hypothetical protein
MDLRNTRMSSRMGLLFSSKTVSSRPHAGLIQRTHELLIRRLTSHQGK